MKGAPLKNIFAQLPSYYEYPNCLGNLGFFMFVYDFLEWFGAHFGVTILNTTMCVEVNDSIFFEVNYEHWVVFEIYLGCGGWESCWRISARSRCIHGNPCLWSGSCNVGKGNLSSFLCVSLKDSYVAPFTVEFGSKRLEYPPILNKENLQFDSTRYYCRNLLNTM